MTYAICMQAMISDLRLPGDGDLTASRAFQHAANVGDDAVSDHRGRKRDADFGVHGSVAEVQHAVRPRTGDGHGAVFPRVAEHVRHLGPMNRPIHVPPEFLVTLTRCGLESYRRHGNSL